MVIRISWDNRILFLSSKNKYYQMLLGIEIRKNGRKFLHPNVKRAHFGHCYIIQRSKNWRQPLPRVVQSLLRRATVPKRDAEYWNNSFSGVTCTTMSYHWLFPTQYHVNRTLRSGKRENARIQVACTTFHFDCLVAFKYIFPSASMGKIPLFFRVKGL